MLEGKMNIKRFSLTTLMLIAVTLALLVGAFGLIVGKAQAPRAKPTLAPTIAVVTPTPTPTTESQPGSASVQGRVWHDVCAIAGGEGGVAIAPSVGCVRTGDGGYQANGLLETGEPGIGGVSVQLGVGMCPASGLATTTTDTSGAYVFTGLSAGTYCVSVDALIPGNASLLPGIWTFPGLYAKSPVASYTITLEGGEQKVEVNFGWDYQFLPLPGPVPTQSGANPTPTSSQQTATATPLGPQPTATPTSVPPTAVTGCTDRAAFVKDVTIPDNTYLLPGQSFVKTWRLRNDGTCTWETDYALVFAGGSNLGGPLAVPFGSTVKPGDTVDLSVTLTAPTGFGAYESRWQLRDADGRLFGIGRNADGPFWVKIGVGPTPTPRITPPTPTPTYVPWPVNWRGEYYANRDLTGNPVLVRDDIEINFNWGTAAPASNLPADRFSVRWSRVLSLPAGTYRFYAFSDDGVRVWLDGELIIDQWRDAFNVTHVAERTLTAAAHTFRVEYYENAGTARISFWWERLGDFPQWRGEYFPNPNLSGIATLVRNDGDINFNWGRGAPASGLPADDFSVRWTRYLPFDEDLYRFHVAMDDGVRLYVDDARVINDWRDGGRREVTGDYRLSAGYHSLRVEYYERVGDASIRVWWEKLNVYPDWRGEYFANINLSGVAALVRNDVSIDFTWGLGSPASNIPADNFSVRWSRKADFDADVYRFHVIVDDGARLWVDDRMLIDAWRDGAARELKADIPLTKGQHSLRLEFYERADNARVRLWWEKTTTASYPDWKGEYWSNRDLRGGRALLRNDKTIDFRWARGAAATGLPVDNFAVRWSRQVNFEPGVYVFSASADDGIRFYLDGQLRLNEWHASDGKNVYTVDATLSGTHQLVVEYYEEGGEALVKFGWKRVGAIPTPTPTPTPTTVPTVPPTPTTVPPTPTTVPPPPTTVPPPPTTVPPTPEPPPVITPTMVLINEILPAPATVDWDGDGIADQRDEWIELYNAGSGVVDLSGWVLSNGLDVYLIPSGTLLQPGALEVFYGQQTGILLGDSGGTVQLTGSADEAIDSVVYVALDPDASYSRDENGGWHSDWPPSPGRANSPLGPVLVPLLGQPMAQ
jgi:hypothetical protein